MREWLKFMKVASRNGWVWLADVWKHVGVALAVFGVVGLSAISLAVDRWEFIAAYVVVVVFGSFSAGAYHTYREAEQQTGEAVGLMILGTLTQLRAKRGQANEWLRKIRDEDYGGTSLDAIEHVFNVFWTSQVREIVEARVPQLLARLDDQSDPMRLANNERERVFNDVQRGLTRLDAVISDLDSLYQEVLGLAGK